MTMTTTTTTTKTITDAEHALVTERFTDNGLSDTVICYIDLLLECHDYLKSKNLPTIDDIINNIMADNINN